MSPQNTEMCAQTEDGTWVSYPPAVQLRFFFLSLPRKLSILSRFAAQDPRPRNGEACFTAAKANRKERYLWQDQPQQALHCWPTQGSRHICQHQPLLRWVPGALCTLQDEAPLLTPRHPASESYPDDSVTEQQWYFHTQGKTLNAWEKHHLCRQGKDPKSPQGFAHHWCPRNCKIWPRIPFTWLHACIAGDFF